eukprot:6349326-Ditylum_brightwellii.AAC.1
MASSENNDDHVKAVQLTHKSNQFCIGISTGVEINTNGEDLVLLGSNSATLINVYGEKKEW